MIRFLTVLMALVLASCSGCTPVAPLPIGPEPPQPDPSTVVVVTVVDAGPEPAPEDAARLDACGKMCVHLRAKGCPDGNPTPAGTTCEVVCRTDKADPVARLTPKYIACLATIKVCSDESRCQR